MASSNVKFAKADSYEKMISLLQKNKINENDIVLVKNKGLFVINDKLEPELYENESIEYSSMEDALDKIKNDPTTFVGQTVNVDGKAYVVNKNETGEFELEPVEQQIATQQDIKDLFNF